MIARLLVVAITCLASPAFAETNWTGNYTGRKGPYSWSATIAPNAGGSFKVKIEVGSQRPPCMGELETTAEVRGNQLVTLPPAKGDECKVTISKNPTGISLKENSCIGWHGASCEFSSQLKRR